eukprot:TRINITY_DN4364_c0_g1_i2.p1 TRINITY_DN4364_c0_g1~~TRINITY_DN4364_c0_g1_i2.p1  ORF type:complete len:497 (-),score=85.59 TRINITY_DN4364_c0_g1_i2:186-1676(-)
MVCVNCHVQLKHSSLCSLAHKLSSTRKTHLFSSSILTMTSFSKTVAARLALFVAPAVAFRSVMNDSNSDPHGYGALLELDDFYNASLELELQKCVITGSNGRRLKLGQELGRGAEGIVYKSGDADGNYAAVKLLKPGVKLDGQEVRNLQKLSVVRSKHINNLEEGFERVQQCCGRPCLVTELITGKDAAKMLWDNGLRTMKDVRAGRGRKGALSYKLLRSLVLQAFAAFRDTEKAGLCNGDQHLRNVMYEEETERIVFIDFGHANSYVPCSPSSPFGKEYSDATSLQQWSSLAYLLADPAEQREYLTLCDHIAKHKYRSSQALLDKGVNEHFLHLHDDTILAQMLSALNATGSPHIGKVSGPGPWEGGSGGANADAIVQDGRAQQHGNDGKANRPTLPGNGVQPTPLQQTDRAQCGPHCRGCALNNACYNADLGWCSKHRGAWCGGNGVGVAHHGNGQNQHHANQCAYCSGCLLQGQCFLSGANWCTRRYGARWCR